MTLMYGLLQSYVAAFVVGVGIGVVTMSVVRLVRGALNAGD